MSLAQKYGTKSTAELLVNNPDLYLKTYVVLLADVFKTFRKTCMDAYKLDHLHYYTAPDLSWDALVKHTKIDL